MWARPLSLFIILNLTLSSPVFAMRQTGAEESEGPTGVKSQLTAALIPSTPAVPKPEQAGAEESKIERLLALTEKRYGDRITEDIRQAIKAVRTNLSQIPPGLKPVLGPIVGRWPSSVFQRQFLKEVVMGGG